MSRRCTLVSLCAWALLSAYAYASGPDEWIQWRGPNRDGISTDTGLMKSWSEEGPPLKWKATGLGDGFSGVSVSHGKIFTMGDRDKSEYVICLNEADGKEVWSTKIGGPTDGGGYHGPRCVPAIDGDRIYALGGNGELACLATADGKEIWTKDFKKDFKGKMMSGWGFSESPLVDGDWLVCTPGGKEDGMVALDKKTGAVVWTSKIEIPGNKGQDGAGYASIVISHGAGVKQYVQLMGRGVVGVRAKDGKQLWSYNKIANGTANIPTVLVKDNYVFTSTGYGDGGSALLKLSPGENGGVEMHEEYYLGAKDLQNHHGGMVMLGDYIYGGHGHSNGFPFCLEWKTGKVLYNHDRGPGRESAAVAYADGLFYFRYQDGTMALMELDPKGFKVISKFKIPDVQKPSWPHPVIIGGHMYLREQDALYCYDVKG
ncbi:MAG TPA: PQQ-binding-like beta-propeller repeat protein [Pirellulales bacterium]|jgi:outer membrane protein assembly factor BamB|nr:PQQ-binding-like beta-propeller repeat protein [Pirellulales bacterium]